MSKPTVTIGEHQTPTQQIIADSNRIVEVIDARGRKIGVRRLSMSVRRRVLKSMSELMAVKDSYMQMVLTSACVVSINGEPSDALAMGGSEMAFDELIDRLDDDGFRAIGKALAEHFPSAVASREEVKNS